MTFFASLPMYDLPEIRTSTDAFWRYLKESMSDHGVGNGLLPKNLTRNTDPHFDWLKPDLVFSQTCGLPYVRDLRGQVSLLGSPAYDIDCAPGSYFSFIIAHKDRDGEDIADFADQRFAFNNRRSQSGFAAYFSMIKEMNVRKLPTQMIESGAHLRSIKMVAEGVADCAAIDAVTFKLAKRHVASTEQVKIIGMSEMVPALPYITSVEFSSQRDVMVNAVIEAMAGLPEVVRNDLLITGFNDRVDSDYDAIRTKWDELVALGWHKL